MTVSRSQPITDDPFVEAMKAEDAKWGDDPAALRETIVKLTERCEAYKGQVKAGSDRIKELEANERAYEAALGQMTYREAKDVIDEQAARIKELEAALREIEGLDNRELSKSDLVQHDRHSGWSSGVRECAEIARAALKGEA